MEKQTIIRYTDDETVVEFRWNHSLTVNVYEGIRQDGYENTELSEVDVFQFADDTSYEEVLETCDQYIIDWTDAMRDREAF